MGVAGAIIDEVIAGFERDSAHPSRSSQSKEQRGLQQVRRIVGQSAVSTLIACVLAASVALVPVVAVAAPTNVQIRAKQALARKADVKLQDLSDDLELKQTDLEDIGAALQATRERIVVTEQQLGAAQAAFVDSTEQLASRVEAIYRGGSVDAVEVLFGTSSFEDFVTRLDLLNRITVSDSDLVARVEADRNRVAQTKSSLQSRAAEEVALRQQAQAKADLVEAAVSRQQGYVNSLTADIKKLMKQESERQARIAAELARAAELAAANHPSTRPSDAGDLGASHPDAAAVARQQLGIPYVWGGTTRSGFDCSGLTYYSYGRIGISIPRTSRAQFRSGQFIPPSRTDLLGTGDLVFFGYGGDPNQVHHVGMYVGGGVFIHAPSTGDHVKYTLLSSRSDYVGAVRP